MRRIEYKVKQDGEPFTIASYDPVKPNSSAEDYQPIKMASFRYSDGAGNTNISHVASLNTTVREDFARRYVDILLGQSTDWVLVQFQIEAGYIDLGYRCPATGASESIMIDIRKNPTKSLNLEFKIPHQDERADTEYSVFMECTTFNQDKPPCSMTIVTEKLSLRRRNTFTFDSDEPGEISVSEYVDL